MSLARVLVTVNGGPDRPIAVLLLLVLLACVPLAHAIPPDPAWIPGLYDDADYDDVVWMLVSSDMVGHVARPAASGPERSFSGFVPSVAGRATGTVATSAVRLRAPPLA